MRISRAKRTNRLHARSCPKCDRLRTVARQRDVALDGAAWAASEYHTTERSRARWQLAAWAGWTAALAAAWACGVIVYGLW